MSDIIGLVKNWYENNNTEDALKMIKFLAIMSILLSIFSFMGMFLLVANEYHQHQLLAETISALHDTALLQKEMAELQISHLNITIDDSERISKLEATEAISSFKKPSIEKEVHLGDFMILIVSLGLACTVVYSIYAHFFKR